MMCALSGRLFDVPFLTVGDRVRRRLVGELALWRPPSINPSELTHHSIPTPPVSPLKRRSLAWSFPVRDGRLDLGLGRVWFSMEA